LEGKKGKSRSLIFEKKKKTVSMTGQECIGGKRREKMNDTLTVGRGSAFFGGGKLMFTSRGGIVAERDEVAASMRPEKP